MSLTHTTEQVREAAAWVSIFRSEMSRAIVGQRTLIDRLLVGLLANGHILLEGVPGLAKTLTVKTLAKALHLSFQRVQFTPDLLPADILGTLIYTPHNGEFSTKKGPIFANIVLADEINRAPAKVQSALLEAMQEHQVTLGTQTYPLPSPFLVLATQNPIDQEGTYALPEAQADRFMLKVKVAYPSKAEEKQILSLASAQGYTKPISAVIQAADIIQARELVDRLYLDEKIEDYIVDLICATRKPSDYGLPLDAYLEYGASPRATIALSLAAKANAFLSGRGYVTPQDVKTMAPDVLRHRLVISYEAEAEGITSEDVITKILNAVPVP